VGGDGCVVQIHVDYLSDSAVGVSGQHGAARPRFCRAGTTGFESVGYVLKDLTMRDVEDLSSLSRDLDEWPKTTMDGQE
jgi:hypothetical protein